MTEATQSSITDWITAVAAIASAVILYFYTIYTHRMQQAIEKQVIKQNRQTKELIHQRRLGIMPSILVKVTESYVNATNVGNGTALNVKFENTINNEKLHTEDFRYDIDSILVILPKATGITKIRSESDCKIPTDWTGLKAPGKIIFQDIEGNNYNQILENLDKKGNLRYGFPVLMEKLEIEKT